MNIFSLPYELIELTTHQYLGRREWLALAGLHSVLHKISQSVIYRAIGGARGCPADPVLVQKYGQHVREFTLDQDSQAILDDVTKYCDNVRLICIYPTRQLISYGGTLRVPDLANENTFPRLSAVKWYGGTGNGADTVKLLRELLIRVEKIDLDELDVSVGEIAQVLRDVNDAGRLKLKRFTLYETYKVGTPVEQAIVDTAASTLQELDITALHGGSGECLPLFASTSCFPCLKTLKLPVCCPGRFSSSSSAFRLNPKQQFPNVRSLSAYFHLTCTLDFTGSSGGDEFDGLELVISVLWPRVEHLSMGTYCTEIHYPIIAKNFPALKKLNAMNGTRSVGNGPMRIGPLVKHFHHLEDITFEWRFDVYPDDMSSDKIDPNVVSKIRRLCIYGSPVASHIVAELLVSPHMREMEVWGWDFETVAEELEKKRAAGITSSVRSLEISKHCQKYIKEYGLDTLLPKCTFKPSYL